LRSRAACPRRECARSCDVASARIGVPACYDAAPGHRGRTAAARRRREPRRDRFATREEDGMAIGERPPSRRLVIASLSCATTGLLGLDAAMAPQALAATPACDDGDEPTVAETEGPYFKARSPLRAELRETGITGRPVELSGRVLGRDCKPLAHAIVDLWHADS